MHGGIVNTRDLVSVAMDEFTELPATAEDIARYLGPEYKPGYNWCAGFAAWCMAAAGLDAPAAGAPRRGARALVKWLAERNGWIVAPGTKADLRAVRPGDVACWRRVRIGWRCHVAIVVAVDERSISVVGGNERGRVNASTLFHNDFRTRLHGLYGVARPRRIG